MTVTVSARSGAFPQFQPVAGAAAAGTPPTHDVAVLGLGYVGLPTALALHATGHRVLGIDVDPDRLAAIGQRRVDLLHADLDRLDEALADRAAFELADEPARLAHAAAVLICVPTPVDPQLVPDLRVLRRACETVVAHAVPGQVLILTSTSYVGTTRELLAEPLAARGLRPGVDVFVAFSPERIDPGNDRPQSLVPRVLGGVTPQCAARAIGALKGYGPQLHEVSSAEAAEMTKLLENSFRAVNIAFANEIAEASRALGLDVREVIDAASTKPFGFMRFLPGPGAGGHCIPCDPYYLLWQLRAARLPMPVTEQAMSALAGRPRLVVDRIRTMLADAGLSLSRARVLVVGVTYKPDVEDLRESPALEIIESLRHSGATVSYHDPYVPRLSSAAGPLTGLATPSAADADLVLMHTLHTGADLSWLDGHPLVLDATYRLAPALGRVRL
ncbi:nucleotide sugar dehydrogenase [Micromonospora sp. CPCC 205711]|uniref:nucleotide sugar dehydrogenase n=1 Tax=Micromonospora sp. CPCC 205547 TaxID=3122400 RepID=UPI002FEF72C9